MEPLIGRESELAMLDAALTSALSGAGRMMLVSGEPGIGKTRIVDAVADRARRRGAVVRRGHAVDDPGMPALWPWLGLARDWRGADTQLRALPEYADPDARFAMFERFTQTLVRGAASNGLVVVLEDLHWADRTTLLLLRHIIGDLAGARILILATFRDSGGSELPALLPDLAGPLVTRGIHLSGLTTAEVTAWLHAAAPHRTLPLPDGAGAARLRARTNGNPLLLRMLLDAGGSAALTEEGPRADLGSLVAARTAGLPADAVRVAAAASVLAERVDPRLLEHVLPLSDDALRAALRACLDTGVLRTDPSGRLVFAHALVRDAVYAEIGAATRSELHRACTTALESVYGKRAAGSIAMHWLRHGGTEGRAGCLRWARAAADEAGRHYGYDEDVRFRELAVSVAKQIGCDDDELATLHLELAEAAFTARRIDTSIAACVVAADHADRAGRADIVAAAGLVVDGYDTGVPPAIRAVCERAVALLGDRDAAVRARLQARLAHAAAEDGGGRDAADLAAAALQAADATRDSTTLLDAIAARHFAITIPQTVEERLRLGGRAVDVGRSSRQPMAALRGHIWRVDAAYQLGNLEEADRELEAVDRIAHVLHSPAARWHHERLVATRAALAGDFPTARERNTRARAVAERFGRTSTTGAYAVFAAQLASVRGDPAEYPPGFENRIRALPPVPFVRVQLPIRYALSGDLDAARTAFEEFRDLPRTMPVGPRWWTTMCQVAVAAVLVDDTEVAGALYPLIQPLASYYTGDGSGAMFCHGSTARIAGDLALLTGSYDGAVRHYVDSVRMNARIGARPFTALSRLGQATALLGRSASTTGAPSGDFASAIGLVQNATAEFGRLDMPGPLSSAASLRDRLSVSLTSALSERENEVAALIAGGLANHAIADRLYLSEDAVDSHVRNIQAKLGFGSRTQIATWAVARQRGRR